MLATDTQTEPVDYNIIKPIVRPQLTMIFITDYYFFKNQSTVFIYEVSKIEKTPSNVLESMRKSSSEYGNVKMNKLLK